MWGPQQNWWVPCGPVQAWFFVGVCGCVGVCVCVCARRTDMMTAMSCERLIIRFFIQGEVVGLFPEPRLMATKPCNPPYTLNKLC